MTIVKRIRARLSKRLDEQAEVGKCRCCNNRPEVQLAPEYTLGAQKVRAEYLCWECLPIFMQVFADPRVVTWNVTVLS